MANHVTKPEVLEETAARSFDHATPPFRLRLSCNPRRFSSISMSPAGTLQLPFIEETLCRL
jgi:hypothetical protein